MIQQRTNVNGFHIDKWIGIVKVKEMYSNKINSCACTEMIQKQVETPFAAEYKRGQVTQTGGLAL